MKILQRLGRFGQRRQGRRRIRADHLVEIEIGIEKAGDRKARIALQRGIDEAKTPIKRPLVKEHAKLVLFHDVHRRRDGFLVGAITQSPGQVHEAGLVGMDRDIPGNEVGPGAQMQHRLRQRVIVLGQDKRHVAIMHAVGLDQRRGGELRFAQHLPGRHGFPDNQILRRVLPVLTGDKIKRRAIPHGEGDELVRRAAGRIEPVGETDDAGVTAGIGLEHLSQRVE